jgi:hypothetical protein
MGAVFAERWCITRGEMIGMIDGLRAAWLWGAGDRVGGGGFV